jgi:iron complex outermembrane receptor protein
MRVILGVAPRLEWVASIAAAGLVSVLSGTCASAETGPTSVEDLRGLSIDELAQIKVTSVSKSPQPISDAAAAIYVITHDDIIRSGAISVPEMLRLAPNLDVIQVSASQYIITARGFSGNQSDQNFSNKILVLIDGRTVYSPLYSGVYWDMQDVLADDIERIEVISGPGATLWGANAVNGVINIITRGASQTQGGLVDVAAGDLGTAITLQYGGQIGQNVTYRLYAKSFNEYQTNTANGAGAGDGWSKPQGGFRLDWKPSASDSLTLQGDGYKGEETQPGQPNQNLSGGDVVARWNHQWASGGNLQVQAYFDRTDRGTAGTSAGFALNTYDLDVQDGLAIGPYNDVVVGGGLRVSNYTITGTGSLLFSPASRTLDLSNIYAQDTLSITSRLKLIGGIKLEDDPYTGVVALPDLRLSWKATDELLVWAAASRAIRSATPFDRDVVEKIGPTVFLIGGPDFEPETLTAYQLGARAQPSSRLTISVAAFYNVYDHLKNIAVAPGGFLPLRWGNMMQGQTYGAEVWGNYQVTSWWRVSASFNELAERLRFAPGASQLTGIAQAGDDPAHQATLRSSFEMAHGFTFDADLRYVSALPNPQVPAYVELDSRLGWNITPRIQIALSGFNLLHASHFEFPASEGATAIPRTFLAQLRWHF